MPDEGGAHDADRMAIAVRLALIPRVKGSWEFGTTSSSIAELVIDDSSPRA
jgi:hypothetical protein